MTAGLEVVRPERLPRRRSAERAAVVLALVSVTLQPFLHPTGPGNSSPVDVAILAAMIAIAIWGAAAGIRWRAPYLLGMGLMTLGGAIAGLLGPLPGTALLTIFQDLVIFMWATAVTNLARRPGVLPLLARVWAETSICWASVLAAASVLGLTAVEGIVAREGNRALFTFGDPNYAATFWVSSIFVVYAAQRPRNPWLRRVGYAVLVWAVVLTESNGGALALVIGWAFLLLLAIARRYGGAGAVASALAAGLVVGGGLGVVPFAQIQSWALHSGQPVLVNSLGRSDSSSGQRQTLVAESLELYRTDGLLGSGPASTKELLQERQYPYAKEAHDDYLAALVERGPMGVLGILALVASAAYRAQRVARIANGPGAGLVARPSGLVAALLAMALAGTYYEVLHFRFVWLLLAMVAAAAALSEPAPAPTTGTREGP
jgi:O-antigen ligase